MSFQPSQAVMFEILDRKVKTKHDVFDALIRVRHCITREEGYLLCSHLSEFPASKVAHATWLAGCYTPEGQEDLPLVFGNIPKQRIHYKVDTDKRTLILSIRGESRAHREQLRAELEATRQEQESAPANIIFDEDLVEHLDLEVRLIEIQEEIRRINRNAVFLDRVVATFYGLMAVVIVGFTVNNIVNPSNIDGYYCTIEEECP